MVLRDVNVLVYAHRQDSPHHRQYYRWLETLVNSDDPYGVSDLVLSDFLRVVTHPDVFNPPSSMEKAWPSQESYATNQLHHREPWGASLGHLLSPVQDRRHQRKSCPRCLPRGISD